MLGASFYTFFFWMAVLAVGFTLIAALAEWDQRRQKRRRIARLVERRRYLDSLEPKRWQP